VGEERKAGAERERVEGTSMNNPVMAQGPPETAPELTFSVEGAAPLEYAAVPTLRFRLRIESAGARQVSAIALNAQLRIAVRTRSYDPATRARLAELLGAPGPDGATIRSLFWTNATLMVPPFMGSTVVDLAVGCTYDFEVAVAKYFHALEEGEVPLEFLLSGSTFYQDTGGALRVGRIPWDREAKYRLPIRVWHEVMEHHFPNSAWLRLPRDSFDRLNAYRARRMLPRWEDAIDALLRSGGVGAEDGSEIMAGPLDATSPAAVPDRIQILEP
jgi:hypothetical protein